MGDASADSLEQRIRINARPEEVFQFLVEPAKMLRWIGKKVDLDPRPGGVFRVDVNGRDVVRGQFLEIVPNRKVVFTWGWEGGGLRVPPGSTTVEITLEPEGEGTLLRLTHRGLTGIDRDKHARGWSHYLARMRMVAEGGDPGPDPLSTPEVRHG